MRKRGGNKLKYQVTKALKAIDKNWHIEKGFAG